MAIVTCSRCRQSTQDEAGLCMHCGEILPRGRFPHPGPLSRQPVYPGHGYPENPGENRPGLSAFGRLAKGQPLGKSSLLIYDAASGRAVAPAQDDALRVEGDDLDACQLLVTLASPRVVFMSFDDALAVLASGQNLTGEQDSQQVGTGNFPGTSDPIAWPPIEWIVEWGTKGTQARAVMDAINGCTFSVVGSFLSIRAAITQGALGAGTGITGTSAVYYVAACVGPGFTTSANPRKTVYVDTIADGGESAVFVVPKFARRAYVVGCSEATPPAVTSAYLRFWQSPDGANNVGNFLQSGNNPTSFDVPSAGAYFNVYNQSGSPMRMSVVFELALS